MLKKGGVESIVAAVVIVGIVIGLIATVVTKVAGSGEKAIVEGINHMSNMQVTMGSK